MKKTIILVLLGLVVLGAGAITFLLKYDYSNGVRSGQLVKISKKGGLFKTYEGTLDLGSGDALTWDFSVHNQKLGEKLKDFSGEFITLTYTERLHKLFYSTKYDVTEVSLPKQRNNNAHFCRLINVLRKSRSAVEAIKPLVQKHDPNLLEHIRNCQN